MRAARSFFLTLGLLGLLAACGGDDAPAGSFGTSCASDDECDSKLCFEYGSKGKRCTETCPADPTSCPNDGAGCNDKGVCKVE